MNAIVTVVGKNNVGIAGSICTLLAENNINILDINQTILHGNFTMIVAVDLEKSSASISEIGEKLEDLGKTLGISIRIQREEIFDAMYRI